LNLLVDDDVLVAGLEPEAELSAFGTEPHAFFGAVVIEAEVGLAGTVQARYVFQALAGIPSTWKLAVKLVRDDGVTIHRNTVLPTCIAAQRCNWPSPFSLAPLLARRGTPVCVLASGDPMLFGVGATLAKQKVALVVAMAGNFEGGEPEYNVRIDVASAKAVFERWPTPIVFSGYEIGRDLLYPAASIEHDFAYARPHPIAESYRAYHQMPFDRPTWDLTAALEAVRPEHGYFGRSEPGTVLVESNGTTRFTAGSVVTVRATTCRIVKKNANGKNCP